jgi:hypothetical protein
MKNDQPIQFWIIFAVVSLMCNVFFDANSHITWIGLAFANFFIGVKYICTTIEKLNVQGGE